MDNQNENSKNKVLNMHIKTVSLFKKIIESAIQLENKESATKTFGYRLVDSDEDDIYLMICKPIFYSLMLNKKIILKTKLKMSKIYFVMFILAQIIEFNMLKLDDNFFFSYSLYYNSKVNNIDINNINNNNNIENQNTNIFSPIIPRINVDLLIEKMLEEEGDFWINSSGHRYPSIIENIENTTENNNQMIFDFTSSTIYQYLYKEPDFCFTKAAVSQSEIPENVNERFKYVAKIGTSFETIYCDSRLSKEEQFFQNFKNSTKFSFDRNDLIEYTLQDILDYLNNQLENYELFKQMNKVQNEAIIEAKNPKMIQRCLNAGQTIDEALNSVGY